MTIRRIRARNFKSFQSLDLRLGQFNVLIGANASGKSNLIYLLSFVRALPQVGFLSAVRAHGGQLLLKNIRTRESIVEIRINSQNTLNPQALVAGATARRRVSRALGFFNSEYLLRFDVGDSPGSARVIGEKLSVAFFLPPKTGVARRTRLKSVARVTLTRSGTRIRLRSSQGKLTIPLTSAFIEYLSSVHKLPIPVSVCLVDNPTTRPFVMQMFPELFGGSFYSLEPKREKELSTPLAPPVLSADGSNLAVAISNIIQNPQGKARFLSAVRDFLPFLKDVRVRDLGSSLLLEALESGSGLTYLPAGALSDGSVNALSLTVALNFERKPLIVLEEPERSVHPQLLGRVIEAAKSLSSDTQVIITTHSAEVVRHSKVDSLLLLTRDKSGNSIVTRPATVSRVKSFLRDNLGVSDLFLLDQLA